MTNFDVNSNSTFTLSLWLKTNATETKGVFGLSQYQDPAWPTLWVPVITMLANGSIRAELWTGGLGDITSQPGYNNNEWHLVTLVAEQSNQKLYVDGEFIGERAGTIDFSWAVYGQIGVGYGTTNRGYTSNAWHYFTGYIDEVRFDTVVRTPQEIKANYQTGKGLRTHQITIDFAARLNNSDAVSDSGDKAFSIDGTSLGLSEPASNLSPEDKIIISENYDGTEYRAQGTVNTVNQSSGAVTVASWDAQSTFPPVGFSEHASVFKWQRVVLDYSGLTLDEYLQNITLLSFRFTNGSEARNIWIDNLKLKSDGLDEPSGSTPASTPNRYFQYRAVFTQNNPTVSSTLQAVNLDYSVDYTTSSDPPSECLVVANPQFSEVTLNWIDPTAGTDTYDIERKINDSFWTALATQPINSTSFIDTSVSPGNTYQYRVRKSFGAGESSWCVTSSLSSQAGNLQLEGLQLEGVQIF
jgi:hypothetical protein